jgi:hypothetical protein
MYYTEIHIKGKIDSNWSDWFGELEIQENTGNETVLIGQLPDMAAVYGVISRLGSLVIPLVSVTCMEASKAGSVNGKIDNLFT